MPVGARREHPPTTVREADDCHRSGRREDPPQPLVDERLAEHVLGAGGGSDLGGGDGVRQRALRVGREIGESRRLERTCAGLASGAAGMRALSEGIDRDRGHRGQRGQSEGSDDGEPPLTLPSRPTLTLEHAAGSPGEDAVGEDVVEDLVALAAAAAVDRAHDPLAAERRRAPARASSSATRRVLGEVAGAVRDLRPGRRHEVVEHRRRHVLLAPAAARRARARGGRARSARRRRAAAASRGAATASRLALGLPEPLQHELEDTAPRSARRRPRVDAAAAALGRASTRPARPGRAPPRRAPARSRHARSPASSLERSTGPTIAARRAARSRWSRRR